MSLHYDIYNNDIDHMNYLIDKYGYNEGMARYRRYKTECGFHEETSYKGAAVITRWVKKEKTAKPNPKQDDSKPDPKPDTPKEKECEGCINDQPNQMAHYGGCLKDPDDYDSDDDSDDDTDDDMPGLEPIPTSYKLYKKWGMCRFGEFIGRRQCRLRSMGIYAKTINQKMGKKCLP